MPNLSIVLGGASSGKSDLAERLVLARGLPPVYLATAQPFDDEMSAKIAAHRATRGGLWQTVDCPLDAAGAIRALVPGQIALLDCATMWLSNHLLADSDLAQEEATLMAALDNAPCPVVVVTNEVGQGVVPDNALARRFRVAQGGLNRRLAERAGLVVAVMAGLPIVLKGQMPDEGIEAMK